jgi:hypothetical protein
MVKVSAHGNQRIRSRCGVPKKSVDRLAAAAFKNGITHAETTGALNKYITSLYFYNKTANNIRIHSDKVFLFGGEMLITVLDLPHRYRKTTAKILQHRKCNDGGLAV